MDTISVEQSMCTAFNEYNTNTTTTTTTTTNNNNNNNDE
jgi:hypothetical protein